MIERHAIPRPEHPRPDFMRDTFQNLNGSWQFAFDDANEGLQNQWQQPGRKLPMTISVPFSYQCKASGIGDETIHPVMWYRRTFRLAEDMQHARILLRFGAVDYACTVYLNGQIAGMHSGGYTPFSIDITPYLLQGENDLCLRVQDDPDCTQPRGKQYWAPGVMGCWYTPCSGIWQTVYLEAVGTYSLQHIHITPDIDHGAADIALTLDRFPTKPLTAEVQVTFQGEPVKTITASVADRQIQLSVDMTDRGSLHMFHLWSPETPNLYDVSIRILEGGTVHDRVRTYFGMRKIENCRGKVLLNHSILYQRLILDQGYWPDTLLTPPSDDAIRKDIELTLALGFNGARKHQKIEDPRYYYWADRMGLLVWGEVPSVYHFTDDSIANLTATFTDFIRRDCNHPCIIAWVPLNESWGVPQIYSHQRQQAAARTLYHLAKALDGTRLVSSNDGWEQVTTDICALHDYAENEQALAKHFPSRAEVEATGCCHRMTYAKGETPTGEEAFMVTEFGGIAFANIGEQGEIGGMATWGYHDKAMDETEFLERFAGVFRAMYALPYNQGFCYTQLTDVLQEINGLLTPDRTPKLDIQTLRRIICAQPLRKS